MKTAEELADVIISRAHAGYHMKNPDIGEPGGYPPYARDPIADRRRWTDYMRVCMVEVLTKELAEGNEVPEPEKKPAETFKPWPCKGDKMVFLGKNGRESELAAANAVFKKGEEYTVADCDVSAYDHRIQFEDVPGSFNGVMFLFTVRNASLSEKVEHEKPHYGRVIDWGWTKSTKQGLGYQIEGRFERFWWQSCTSSYVVARNGNEIETANSRYTLHGEPREEFRGHKLP